MPHEHNREARTKPPNLCPTPERVRRWLHGRRHTALPFFLILFGIATSAVAWHWVRSAKLPHPSLSKSSNHTNSNKKGLCLTWRDPLSTHTEPLSIESLTPGAVIKLSTHVAYPHTAPTISGLIHTPNEPLSRHPHAISAHINGAQPTFTVPLTPKLRSAMQSPHQLYTFALNKTMSVSKIDAHLARSQDPFPSLTYATLTDLFTNDSQVPNQLPAHGQPQLHLPALATFLTKSNPFFYDRHCWRNPPQEKLQTAAKLYVLQRPTPLKSTKSIIKK